MDETLERNQVLYNVLYTVFRRKVSLTMLCGLFVLLILLVTFLAKPTYKATTKILIRPNPQQQLILFKDLATPGQDTQPVNPARNLIQILTGREMAREVVQKFELDKKIRGEEKEPEKPAEPMNRFEEALSKAINSMIAVVRGAFGEEKAPKNYVEEAVQRLIDKAEDIQLEEGSHVINLSIWEEAPELASDIANFMAQRLIERSAELEQVDATQAYDFTKRQIESAEMDLRKSEAALLQFREKNGIISLEEQKASRLQELDRLEAESISTRTAFSEVKAQLEELRMQIPPQKKVLSESPAGSNDGEMKELVSSLNKAEIELAGMLEKFTEENKSVTNLRAKISEIKDRIEKRLEAIMQSENAILASIHPSLPKEYSKLTSDFAALKAKQEALDSAIDALEAEAFSLSKKETELERLNRHRETTQRLYTNLLDKYTQLEVQKAFHMSGYDVKIIDKAFLAEDARPDRPKWSLVIPLGFIGSLLLSFVVVFFIEYWDESFKSPRDVEQRLDVDVLCTVPDMSR